ncbi:MAG: CPBP family intramembrane metalloprotease [Bacilli bacterium]|nr:CPBP family intramembrane metalloprotease [Bacilli bacterium]
MKNESQKTKHLSIGIGVLFFYFAIIFFPFQLLPFSLLDIDYKMLPLWIRIIYAFIFEVIQFGIIIFLLKDQLKKDLIDLKQNHNEYFKKYFIYWFILLGAMMASNLLIVWFTPNEIANNEQSIHEMLKMAPIYTFITAVFIAPFQEEFVFRKAIRNIISNDILFILVSGLLFGSLHVVTSLTSWWQLLYIIPYSIPGFIFAYLLVKTNNIFVSGFIHFIHNGVLMSLQILLLLLGQL